MSNKFDDLAMGLAQSATRRQALKKFGIGLAGMALACFGLAGVAEAGNPCIPGGGICDAKHKCCKGLICLGQGPGLPAICSTGYHGV